MAHSANRRLGALLLMAGLVDAVGTRDLASASGQAGAQGGRLGNGNRPDQRRECISTPEAGQGSAGLNCNKLTSSSSHVGI